MKGQNIDKINIEASLNVLVIGGGWTGINTANKIIDLGYKVLLIESENDTSKISSKLDTLQRLNEDHNKSLENHHKRVLTSKDCEYLSGTRLLQCNGMPGNFKLQLGNGVDNFEKTVGAIVIAEDFTSEPLFEYYGLTASDKIISQSQLESLLDLGDKDTKNNPLANAQHIAFFVGFGQEGDSVTMYRVMRSVQEIEKHGYQAYVYVNNLKVTDEGLEDLYRDNLALGALYFKLLQKPKVTTNGIRIIHNDSILDKEVELKPDVVVIEEELRPSYIHRELAQNLRLNSDQYGFLQENNVNRFPIYTNRKGIYVVGGSRSIMSPTQIKTDIDNVSLDIHKLLNKGQIQLPKKVAEIDKEKCCFCLTCFRSCPHGAIYWEDKPHVYTSACQACGICASECPQNAIQIIEYHDDLIKNQILQATKQKENLQAPCIVAFCCENSAYESGIAAQKFNRTLPSGLHMVKVPCAGKINLDYLFYAFIQGADGVMVLSCHMGCCKSVKGNTFANWRVDNIQRMLKEIGLDKKRIFSAHLASNSDIEFSKLTVQMEEDINKLGNSLLLQ